MQRVVFMLTLIVFGTANEAIADPSLKMPAMSDEAMRCDQDNWNFNPQGNENNDNTTHQDNELAYAWDFNLTSGQSTDLGLPVIAAAKGRVVYAQDYATGLDPWGKCVVVQYSADGSCDNLSSSRGLYAHLTSIFVTFGECVEQGQVVGALGDADGYYPSAAHLHYQVQSGDDPDAQSNILVYFRLYIKFLLVFLIYVIYFVLLPHLYS